jgi:hypothetical protein
VQDDATSAKGLSVPSVSVWGETPKVGAGNPRLAWAALTRATQRITYVQDDKSEGLLFVKEAVAKVESAASETRPKSISVLYCVKI